MLFFSSNLAINLVHVSINKSLFPPTMPASKMRLHQSATQSYPDFHCSGTLTVNEVFPLFAEILEIMASVF